jgi:hypothetical protein
LLLRTVVAIAQARLLATDGVFVQLDDERPQSFDITDR